MKKRLQNKKNQMGFSMIELMMVVVIIGILAGVGIPQYQKFQMKARQSEARSLMSAMYTVQKAFFAEWNRFYADFNAVGYGLEGNLGYTVGFTGNGPNGPANHPNNTYRNAAPLVISANTYCTSTTPNPCNLNNSNRGAALGAGRLPAAVINAGATTFTFGAAANIDADNTIDQWTIDQVKTFNQVRDDISQ